MENKICNIHNISLYSFKYLIELKALLSLFALFYKPNYSQINLEDKAKIINGFEHGVKLSKKFSKLEELKYFESKKEEKTEGFNNSNKQIKSRISNNFIYYDNHTNLKKKHEKNIYYKTNQISLNKETRIKIKLNKIRLLLYYSFIFLITLISPKSNLLIKNLSKYSYVTLKVSTNGLTRIFYNETCQDYSFTKPNEVWIDNIKQPNVTNSYQLIPTNIVKLKWTNKINNCSFMFYGCNSIIEIY